MLTAQIQCPNCKALFLAKETEQFKKVRCSKCKIIFNIGVNPETTQESTLNNITADNTVDLKNIKFDFSKTGAHDKTIDITGSQVVFQNQSSDGQISLRSFLQKMDLVPKAELQNSVNIKKGLEESSRYIYGDELARGGMGAIISTRDLDTKRNLVTKTLLKNSSKKALLRFIEEAQITAQLEHPNIVPVYDIGVNREGNIFYTMKHVKGINLQELINQYFKQDADEIKITSHQNRLIEILIMVCNAVAFAHSKKVIHRDLKPENIMIGEYGEVILMDFGLAKILTNDEEDIEELSEPISSIRTETNQMQTIQGDISGTPKFMAPEQARGDVKKQDERTDIYALGAILFTCLTSKPPISGQSINEVLDNVIDGIRNPLPENVSPELAAIVSKAMELGRGDRYQTVKEFSDDLQLFLKGYSISAKEDHFGEIILKLIKRNYPVFLTTSIAFILLIVLGTIAISHILKEKETAVSNLNKYLEAQKLADAQKVENASLQNEKVKQWKHFYQESFKDLKYFLLPEGKDDYGFGNWIVPEGKKDISPFDFKNDFTLLQHKAWLTNNVLYFSSHKKGYLYLNKELFGNFRVETTISYIDGLTPALTLFIYGNKENLENDGYRLVLGTKLKFQKKGETIYEKKLSQPVEPNIKYNIRLERIGNKICAYVNDLTHPEFQWEDPEPIYGDKNSTCGIYIQRGQIAIDKFIVTKQAWAKQNTPLDFVDGLRKKGYSKLAIEEYKEIIFATEDPIQKAEAYFEMGSAYKNAGLIPEAENVLNRLIQKKISAEYGISLVDESMAKIIRKSYAYLFLIQLDADFEKLDADLIAWPEKLKSRLEDVIKNCGNQNEMEIIFNYMITKTIKKELKQNDQFKGFHLLKLLLKNMNADSLIVCQNSYAELLYDFSLTYASIPPTPYIPLPEEVVAKAIIAENLISEAIALKSNDDKFLKQRGFIRTFFFRDNEKIQEGLKDIGHTIEINPLNLDAYILLTRYYLIIENEAKAISIMKEGLKAIPNSLELHFMIAKVYIYKGKFEELKEITNSLEKLSPNHPQTNFIIGSSYFRQKQFDNLEKLLSETEKHKFYPENFSILNGYLLVFQKKYKEAIATFIQIPENLRASEAKLNLAIAYYETGEYQMAKDNLLKINKNATLEDREKELMKKVEEKLIPKQ